MFRNSKTNTIKKSLLRSIKFTLSFDFNTKIQRDLYIQTQGTALNRVKGNGRINKRNEPCIDKTLRKSHDDFIEYFLNEVTGFLAILRKIKDGYLQATETFSERVYVLANFDLDTFKSIAKEEHENGIIPTFGGQATRWAADDLSICLTRLVKDRDSPAKDKFIYKYDLECSFGLNHQKFIKWLIFPELLTRFFMSTYSIDFKMATGRIYGNREPTNTTYFNEIEAIELS